VSTVVGVGVDLCEVDRMRRTLARTPGFATRVYTDAEREHCGRRRDPAEGLAARFAAKEAVLKALGRGLGACSFRTSRWCERPPAPPRSRSTTPRPAWRPSTA
jgi:holo-[acyl-carrier protein] synthase